MVVCTKYAEAKYIIVYYMIYQLLHFPYQT